MMKKKRVLLCYALLAHFSAWPARAIYADVQISTSQTYTGQAIDGALSIDGNPTPTLLVDSTANISADKNAADILVGVNAGGTLTINGATVTNSGSGLIATQAGSTSSVVVQGANAAWTTSNIFLGGNGMTAGGQGSLTISNTGSVTVAELTKLWSADDSLSINGGSLTTKSLDLTNGSFNFTNGTLKIQGGNLKLADPLLEAYKPLNISGTTATANPTLILTNDGATGAQTIGVTGVTLGIGHGGNGTLIVEGGSKLFANTYYALDPESQQYFYNPAYSTLGQDSGSSGTATVRGAGSEWNSTGELSVGIWGPGYLDILQGGSVRSVKGRIGTLVGASGSIVNVDGAGSEWINTGTMTLGYSGSGTLNISNGGKVTNLHTYIAYADKTSQATVSGAGSTWEINGGLDIGRNSSGNGQVTVANQGVIRVTGHTKLYPGSTLNINSGGQFTTRSIDIRQAGFQLTQGTLEVKGGSYEQDYGILKIEGSNTIENPTYLFSNDGANRGGTIGVAALVLGGNAGRRGSLVIDGGSFSSTGSGSKKLGTIGTTPIYDGWSFIGLGANSIGSVNLKNGGGWSASYLVIGGKGQGSLIIESGATADINQPFIGFDTGSTGTLIVRGVGSKLTTPNELYFGDSGNAVYGTISIEDGGVIQSAGGYLESNLTTGDVVTITGQGSKWINSGTFFMDPNHKMTIREGGQLQSNVGLVAGTLKLEGRGSNWTNTQDISIQGTGLLQVSAQASLSARSLLISYPANNANAEFQGAGTTGTFTQFVSVGHTFKGNLTVSAGATINCATGMIAAFNGSQGDATVTGNGSRWNAANLYLGGNATTASNGKATLTIEDQGLVKITATTKLWSTDDAINVNGGTLETGTLDALVGSINVSSGTLRLTNGTSKITNLSINATGKLDLTNNDLIVDNGNLAAVTALLAAGLDINGSYGGGPGITSSAFASNPNFNTVLGVAPNSSLNYASFSGQTVDANDVLIKYTYFGDADLNGVVDSATDFDLYITGLTSGGSIGGWLYGDFDYSGTVDSATDFDLYITGLTTQGAPLLTAGGGSSITAIPEPSAFVLAGLGLLGLAGMQLRRRVLCKR